MQDMDGEDGGKREQLPAECRKLSNPKCFNLSLVSRPVPICAKIRAVACPAWSLLVLKGADTDMVHRFFRVSLLLAAIVLWFGTYNPAQAIDSVPSPSITDQLFPADNWWNLDVSGWPVDPNSASYIAFINNGGTRRLHPDLGGDASTAQNPYAIYGMPYAVVSDVMPSDLVAVDFFYSDESDGVDHETDTSFPFYPIPPEAATEPYWIEGGDPGNVDRRNQDRHLLILDSDRNYLYELYNVYYDPTENKWYAGSGAFFDMNTNDRRPDSWTSADAAGLAILPGLIRYDEVYDPSVAEIGHALRVTVRRTNGYVYPASHRAGSTSGALPMGARLRLKASVNVTERTGDPNVQKIFRAMQKHGLIVADNGSDMYLTGTYDTRWDNGILNPAFAELTASDFEVIELGYNPPTQTVAALRAVRIGPSDVTGGQTVTGTVDITAAAPAEGIMINLSADDPAVTVPATVAVVAGATSANFSVNTFPVRAATAATITANYAGVNKTAALTVNPPALSSLILNPATVPGGTTSIGTVRLDGNAPFGGIVVAISSSRPGRGVVPPTVTIPAGAGAATFSITTTPGARVLATISASFGGITKKATLTVQKKRP
jgi:hypothetical protein